MAKTVAVVGASADRRKFGNKAVRAYRAQGYSVYPINPHEAEVEGLKTYRSVLDVPGTIDVASVYVHPEIGVGLLKEFAQKQIPEIWINPGAESDTLVSEGQRLRLNIIQACSIIGIGDQPSRY